jgi:hypothetical protein
MVKWLTLLLHMWKVPGINLSLENLVFLTPLVSSVSVVPDYGLDDRAIGVQSPAEAKDFSSSLCVQTGCGAHPASYPMGAGGPFPGGKVRPGVSLLYLSPKCLYGM